MDKISQLIPDVLDIECVGCDGNITIVPQNDKNKLLPSMMLPFGLPPIISDLKEQLEEFLDCPEKLPIYDLDNVQSFIPREPCPESLFSVELAPCQTNLKVERDIISGKLLDFTEVELRGNVATSKNSTSLKRAPGPPSEAVTGSTTNYPFWPGGMDEMTMQDLKAAANEGPILDLDKDLLTIPPGFKNGMNFQKPIDEGRENVFTMNKDPHVLTLADIMAIGDNIDLTLLGTDAAKEEKMNVGDDMENEEPVKILPPLTLAEEQEKDLDNVISKASVPVLHIKSAPVVRVLQKTEWAEEVDITKPIPDFKHLIPEMAYEWPFELDLFQKYAILHLEQHNNVFVAAHTSAGKTVVAEYAIALARKHMMRVIYTSPIKALSNQKYRDFRITFGDVGLLTGDMKLKPEASCLIMTTEILRNMLYSGADALRDLEWVIFDEVHYINDAQRGVVWEEVLIMLPQHVKLVLLSATVPNHIEFADWIGRTKRSKLYVIKTLKRPVPLEHFLYTGNGGKSKDERFLIVDDKGKFLRGGYDEAVKAKAERSSKFQQSYGPKGQRTAGISHEMEKTTYIGLIQHLKKNEKLPAVCFTLSRKRCDNNASMLQSLDLTDKEEKHKIKTHFKKYISRLQRVDQKLPQVIFMESFLIKGIAVHHSGILPILKEIVELLFQQGLVKLLFATETFAMGVNMPARTVVFDSIRKHDGIHFRELLPSEYIQMAGRAGRRGLDKTGTVIIMAKDSVPDSLSLNNMMLGRPTVLESQFRLTYRMILNLLRVKDKLRVEDVMKRSFGEAGAQRILKDRLEEKDKIEIELNKIPELECQACSDIWEYYQQVKEWEDLTSSIMMKTAKSAQGAKCFEVGNLMIIKTNFHQNVPAVIIARSSRDPKLSVITLTEQCESDVQAGWSEKNYQNSKYVADNKCYLPWTDKIFFPSGTVSHAVFDIPVSHVRRLTQHSFKIDGSRVQADWSKRQQPRFSDDPPGATTMMAVQALIQKTPEVSLTENIANSLPVKDPELVEPCLKVQQIQSTLKSYLCIHCPSLNEHFAHVDHKKQLEERLAKIKYELSDESLQLAGDFGARKMVLRELRYIDDNNVVQLKGRVACEMNNHELVLTELLFRESLASYQPEEIAAMLSCTVFQQNVDNLNEQMKTWPSRLQQGVECVESIARNIEGLQKEFGLEEPVEEELKFGLANVVYEWAKGETFAHIMQMDEVKEGRQIQEGIVVRCIQRLDEVLKDMRNGCKLVGDTVLAEKFAEASQNIRRDIVFAASLYTQSDDT